MTLTFAKGFAFSSLFLLQRNNNFPLFKTGVATVANGPECDPATDVEGCSAEQHRRKAKKRYRTARVGADKSSAKLPWVSYRLFTHH